MLLLPHQSARSFQLPSSYPSSRHIGEDPFLNIHILNSVRDDVDSSSKKAGIIFPGGGLFFYWQAGVIAYLQENNYDLSTILFSGASAGALSATLAKTSTCPYEATELALRMSDEAGVWDRPLGLMGIWGDIIYNWLDELLPLDAVDVVNDEVCL